MNTLKYGVAVLFNNGSVELFAIEGMTFTAALTQLLNGQLSGHDVASVERADYDALTGAVEPVAKAQVHNRKKRPSRADRFSSAQGDVSQALAEAQELREELQGWLDNLPENLQNGGKADQLNEAISNLDEFISNLESAEGTDVEFPGMFG